MDRKMHIRYVKFMLNIIRVLYNKEHNEEPRYFLQFSNRERGFPDVGLFPRKYRSLYCP